MTEQELFLDPVHWDDTITTNSGATFTIEELYHLFRRRLESNAGGKQRQKLWTLPHDVDPDVWETWVNDRTARGIPMKTSAAKTENANMLRGKPVEVQRAIVSQSIRNGWRGLFEVREEPKAIREQFDEQFEGAL